LGENLAGVKLSNTDPDLTVRLSPESSDQSERSYNSSFFFCKYSRKYLKMAWRNKLEIKCSKNFTK